MFNGKQSEEVSIIVVGSINGAIQKADRKLVEAVARERPHSIFVSGSFFGYNISDKYRTGLKQVQAAVNVLGATSADVAKRFYQPLEREMIEVIPNVTYMGKLGVSLLPGGVTVAFLSGTEGTRRSMWTFTQADVDELIFRCRRFPKIDLLLTLQWPDGLDTSQSDPPITVKSPSQLIAYLVASVKPTLHIAAMEEVYFVSPPMVHGNCAQLTTRFVGLAGLNKKGEGWMFTGRFPLPQESSDTPTVPSPFGEGSPAVMGYIAGRGMQRQLCLNKTSTDMNLQRPASVLTCWYCRAYLDRALTIATGRHSYLSLVQNPLVDKQTVIVPISHVSSLSVARARIIVEVNEYLLSLSKYTISIGMDLVWYEESFETPHARVNVLPVEPSVVSRNTICSEMIRVGQMEGLPTAEIIKVDTEDWRKKVSGEHYIYVEVWGKFGYLMKLRGSEFPLNFTRRVLAQALGVPERKFRNYCRIATVADASRFRRGFDQFNLTTAE